MAQPVDAAPAGPRHADAPADITASKVHIRGLDNMSTADVKAYVLTHLGGAEPVKFEWIDDTSLNVVYPDDATAMQALLALAANPEGTLPWDLREAKRAASHPLARLDIRLPRESDR